MKSNCGKRFITNWKLLFTIALPILLLPLLFIHVEEVKSTTSDTFGSHVLEEHEGPTKDVVRGKMLT